MNYSFTCPTSLKEAEERAAELLLQKEEIEQKLSAFHASPNHFRAQEWRRRAITALKYKTKEYTDVKNWIKERKKTNLLETLGMEPNPEDPRSLLGACIKVFRGLKDDEVEFTEKELLLQTMIKDYLKNDDPTI